MGLACQGKRTYRRTRSQQLITDYLCPPFSWVMQNKAESPAMQTISPWPLNLSSFRLHLSSFHWTDPMAPFSHPKTAILPPIGSRFGTYCISFHHDSSVRPQNRGPVFRAIFDPDPVQNGWSFVSPQLFGQFVPAFLVRRLLTKTAAINNCGDLTEIIRN